MADLKFNSNSYTLEEHESVLDCLLRNGQSVPYACKAGMCQACLVKAVNCEATELSKKWIKPTLQAKGYTLACQWVPDSDVETSLPSVEEFSVAVSILELKPLNLRTLCVTLEAEEKGSMFHYTPGQYITLINPEGIARSYSVANSYEDDGFIELHISETKEGLFTHWLFHQAAIGDTLHMRGPAGDCFYTNSDTDDNDFPMLLAGTGTGLAPLYGIINDALSKNHQGEISLFHGGRTPAHLYYQNELKALASQHKNFNYYPSILEPEQNRPFEGHTAKIEDVVDEIINIDELPKTHVYLCGAPDFVHGLRKNIFLKGARSNNIFCDPFLERSVAVK